jgi:hypothetical protein
LAGRKYSAGVVWVPISAWLAALVVALIVLGFFGYEIVWKTRRLRADLDRLRVLGDQLGDLQGRLAETRERIAAAGLR